jgi:hypothetical protein
MMGLWGEAGAGLGWCNATGGAHFGWATDLQSSHDSLALQPDVVGPGSRVNHYRLTPVASSPC